METNYSNWFIERIPIGDRLRLRIGRNDIGRCLKSVIRIDSAYVSRNHALINVSRDQTVVEVLDFNSANGTFVNSARLDSVSRKIIENDLIGFGVPCDDRDIADETTLPIYIVKYIPNASFIPSRVSTGSREAPSTSSKPAVSSANEATSRDDKICANSVNRAAEGVANNTPANNDDVIIVDSDEEMTSNAAATSVLSDKTIDESASSDKSDSAKAPDKSISERENAPAASHSSQKAESVKSNGTSKKEVIILDIDDDSREAPESSKEAAAQHETPSSSTKPDSDETNAEAQMVPTGRINASSETPTGNTLADGLVSNDIICLDSDDEGTRQKKTKPSVQQVLEDVFGSVEPLMDNLKRVAPDTYEIIRQQKEEEKIGNRQQTPSLVSDENDILPNEDENDDSGEMMYSQALVNDIKAEFVNEDQKSIESLSPRAQQVPVQVQQGNLQNSPIWVMSSDEEDTDKEFSQMVSGWSSRVFDHVSQVYATQVNMADHASDNNNDEIGIPTSDNEGIPPIAKFDFDDSDEEKEFIQIEMPKLDLNDNDLSRNSDGDSVSSPSIDLEMPALPQMDTAANVSESKRPESENSKNDTKPHKSADKLEVITLKTRQRARRLSSSEEEDDSDANKEYGRAFVSKPPKMIECSVKVRRLSNIYDIPCKPTPKIDTPNRRKSMFAERPQPLSKQISRGPPIIDAQPLIRRRSRHTELSSTKRKGTSPGPTDTESKKAKKGDACPDSDESKQIPDEQAALDSIVQQIRNKDAEERYAKEMKIKWMQKRKVPRREKEKIRAKRKSKLREVAEKEAHKSPSTKAEATKTCDESKPSTSSRAKVKVTSVNRGVCFTKDIPPSLRSSKTKQHKQAAADPKRNPEQIRKEAEIVRAAQKPGKVTFARMEEAAEERKRIEAKFERCEQKKLKKAESTASSEKTKPASRPPEAQCEVVELTLPQELEPALAAEPAREFRQSTRHDQRREQWRTTCRRIDKTNDIVSMLLKFSNNWLRRCNVELDALSNTIPPKPKQFASFDEYKEIFFGLMRLEYLSELESCMRKVKESNAMLIRKDNITSVTNRTVLIAKGEPADIDAQRYDLVLLCLKDSLQETKKTFAYLSSFQRGRGSDQANTLVLEALSEELSADDIVRANEIRMLNVMDNLQVMIGALKAIYHLEVTPLREAIINPLKIMETALALPPTSSVRCKAYDAVNSHQKCAILQAYLRAIQDDKPTISMIKGPPGTGKSVVIANLTLQLLYGHEVTKLDNKILICAQSNQAVDTIAKRLYRITQNMAEGSPKFRILRYGVYERISPNLRSITLQKLIQKERFKRLRNQDPAFRDVENMDAHLQRIESDIKRLVGQRCLDFRQKRELIEKRRQQQIILDIKNPSGKRSHEEVTLRDWYLKAANIVCTTLSSCVSLSQYLDYFDVCITDEATQCTEPWTLIPLRFGIKSLVLVGDSLQLPATVISKKASDLGLRESMFTRIEKCYESQGSKEKRLSRNFIYELRTQYRMDPEICLWPNAYFYKDRLRNAESTLKFEIPLLPFAVLHLEFSEDIKLSQGKIKNHGEASFVAALVKAVGRYMPFEKNSYGIITPYTYQKKILSTTMREMGLPDDIYVNTIDSYQGLEKDVIIVSNTRTAGVGFLGNYQRLNVAITRPRKCLLMCGNFKDLETSPAWRDLLKNARQRNLFFSINAENCEDIEASIIQNLIKKKAS